MVLLLLLLLLLLLFGFWGVFLVCVVVVVVVVVAAAVSIGTSNVPTWKLIYSVRLLITFNLNFNYTLVATFSER